MRGFFALFYIYILSPIFIGIYFKKCNSNLVKVMKIVDVLTNRADTLEKMA